MKTLTITLPPAPAETTPRPMTPFDRQLIAKAESLSRYYWEDVRSLIRVADTDEARRRLHFISVENHQLCRENYDED